jgi:hypothetical protein
MRLLQEKSSHKIDPRQSIVVGKVGGNQSSNTGKVSVMNLQELLPVYMYALYQYGPMAGFLEGDLVGVLILAIVELSFYKHGGKERVSYLAFNNLVISKSVESFSVFSGPARMYMVQAFTAGKLLYNPIQSAILRDLIGQFSQLN